jgi:flagellar protein FlaI
MSERLKELFPNCPICGSSKGYEKAKDRVRCKSCKAEWIVQEDGMELKKASKLKWDREFLNEKHPFEFWTGLRGSAKEEEKKEAEKPAEKPLVDLRFRVEPHVAAFQGEVLDKYVVDQATVFVVDENGKGVYAVNEPPLDPDELKTYSLLMENLFYSLKPLTAKVEDPMAYVESFIWNTAEELGILDSVGKSFKKYRYYMVRDAFGYGPIHVPMNDEDVEEVGCVGYGRPVNVIHRRFTEYDWLETNILFRSEDELAVFNQRLAQRCGKSLTVAIPFADAMTREGHRLALTFAGEVTLPGSSFAVRKFPQNPFSMTTLLKFGTLSPLMAAYLWLIEDYKGFIMVLGPTGSGKTTLANALLTMVSPDVKIATIEDTPELVLPHVNWQRFKARHTYSITESRYEVDLLDLVKLSMRFRPDHVVVGEVRGEEVRALVQAAALGHGCACTIHAESPYAAIVRMRSPPMDVAEGGLMLIWCFVTLNRVKTAAGKAVRRVLDVTEVVPKVGGFDLKEVFRWDAKTDSFSPEDAGKVVERSKRLETVKRLAGWDDERLEAELSVRAEWLRKLTEEGKLSYPDFSNAVRTFYIKRRKGENVV